MRLERISLPTCVYIIYTLFVKATGMHNTNEIFSSLPGFFGGCAPTDPSNFFFIYIDFYFFSSSSLYPFFFYSNSAKDMQHSCTHTHSYWNSPLSFSPISFFIFSPLCSSFASLYSLDAFAHSHSSLPTHTTRTISSILIFSIFLSFFFFCLFSFYVSSQSSIKAV